MKERSSVFNPVEQRIFGLVQIAQGVAVVVLGKYAPAWSLQYAKWGALRAHRRRELVGQKGER